MNFLIDTNICSAYLRRPGGLAHRFIQHSGRLFIPTIVLAELYAWGHSRDDPTPILENVNLLLKTELQVVGFDESCAAEYGRLRAQLKRLGIGVSPFDMVIARPSCAT